MTLKASVNGILYSRATSISVSRSVGNLLGSFEIRSSADEFNDFPIKANDKIQILDDNREPLLTGFVERISVEQGIDTHEITASGRDITADLLDSSLVVKQFTGPISILSLINQVLRHQGLQSIKVVDQSGGLDRIGADELVSGRIGQSAFGFLEQYARRVQAVLTTNGEGNLVLLRSGLKSATTNLIRQKGNKLTNIKKSSIVIDYSGRFRDYKCQSQLSLSGPGQAATVEEVTGRFGSATDRGVRAGRFSEFQGETVMDSKSCDNRAKLEANVSRANSMNYRATVQGSRSDFNINNLVSVFDDVCGINDTLLISGFRSSFDLNNGTETSISATFRDAYSLQEELDLKTAARSQTGSRF